MKRYISVFLMLCSEHNIATESYESPLKAKDEQGFQENKNN